MDYCGGLLLPSGYDIQFAVENCHSELSHEKNGGSFHRFLGLFTGTSELSSELRSLIK
jgi:hypothetical protein